MKTVQAFFYLPVPNTHIITPDLIMLIISAKVYKPHEMHIIWKLNYQKLSTLCHSNRHNIQSVPNNTVQNDTGIYRALEIFTDSKGLAAKRMKKMKHVIRAGYACLITQVIWACVYIRNHGIHWTLEILMIYTYIEMSHFKRLIPNSYNKSQQDALFLNFILVKNSACFGQTYCPSSGVPILYSQQLVFAYWLYWLSAREVPSWCR